MPPTFVPRPGQRLKFHLEEPWKTECLEAGAHQTPDGFFLGTFIQAGAGPSLTHRTADGREVVDGGEIQPPRVMVVDGNDNNVMLPFRDEASGHAEFRPACFHPNDLPDLHPLDDVAHMPPGHKSEEGWKPPEQLWREQRQERERQQAAQKKEAEAKVAQALARQEVSAESGG